MITLLWQKNQKTIRTMRLIITSQRKWRQRGVKGCGEVGSLWLYQASNEATKITKFRALTPAK